MTGAESIVFPLLATLCWAAFFYKIRSLRFERRAPALLALLTAFALKGTAFVLATPVVARAVDRQLGIPDIAALCIHLLGGVAFSAAVLVVLVFWAHAPEQAWPRARWRLGIAVIVMLTMLSLWIAAAAGSSGRSTHYLVQNANRPVVDVYLLLYVSTLLVALVEIARLCRKYAEVSGHPWLRRGLRVTAMGALIYSINFVNRASDVVIEQLDLNPLKWEILTLLGAGIGIPLIVGGLTIPSWGPHLSTLHTWWNNYRTYRSLHPLWLAMYQELPEIVLPPPASTLSNLNYRLYRRIIEIRDGQIALRPYMNSEISVRTAKLGREAGLAGNELRAVIEAAQLKAALGAKVKGGSVPVESRARDDFHVLSDLSGGDDLASEAHWLSQLARAFMHSPVVAASVIDRCSQRTER
ncbi:MAB_1171c family putative transporter [Streptomyces natalensis]|uniref:MAB_1171c family putative transporter n=1 Tax=Streptomyces natalensis TaxID=68242 RepID=UPI000B17E89C|nr:MAB_1171c family putative transporter [Streptomyces natalensis]